MDEFKYVIFNETTPIIFPSVWNHIDFTEIPNGEITSAGFGKIRNGIVKVYGRSISLDKGPADGDAFLISLLLGLRKREVREVLEGQ